MVDGRWTDVFEGRVVYVLYRMGDDSVVARSMNVRRRCRSWFVLVLRCTMTIDEDGSVGQSCHGRHPVNTRLQQRYQIASCTPNTHKSASDVQSVARLFFKKRGVDRRRWTSGVGRSALAAHDLTQVSSRSPCKSTCALLTQVEELNRSGG
jgi:hypothetical protein